MRDANWNVSVVRPESGRHWGPVLTACLALGIVFAVPAEAIDKCKVKIDNKSGVVLVSATGVQGPLKWGNEADQVVTDVFEASCVSAGKAKNCTLADPTTAEAMRPPERCTLYLGDDAMPCSAYIKGCTPGVRTLDTVLSDIASRHPPTCVSANGLNWCYHPTECGHACDETCNANGLSSVADNTTWLEAQDSIAECQAISEAFGLGSTVNFNAWAFGCSEDSIGPHGVLGGLLGPIFCSSALDCPAQHRTGMDYGGIPCGPASRRSICPCE